jgi:4'-phosphopantetheinyl transferase
VSATHDSLQAQAWQPGSSRSHLGDDEIHVWRAVLARPPSEVEALRELLSDDELERADRFRFPHDRSSFIVARGTPREILSRYLRLPPALLRFDCNDFGKPELRAATFEKMLRFNLT